MDIALSPSDGIVSVPGGKRIEIQAGATLTVPAGVTLQVGGGLDVKGTLSVAGIVNVLGWINANGDWSMHIQTTGSGVVNTFEDLQGFATDLYDWYSRDYGLPDTAAHDAYQSCYDPNYFANPDPRNANFIKAINRERKTTVILTTHDMQDIEALTERIILIGKGQILLDGALCDLKKRNSSIKTITVEYNGVEFSLCGGASFSKKLDGHATVLVDTNTVSVSEVITHISSQVEVSDISVAGSTAEEMVVSLYKEFSI
jgi:hypothetical protein